VPRQLQRRCSVRRCSAGNRCHRLVGRDVERRVAGLQPTGIATNQSVYRNDSAAIYSTVGTENLPAGGTVVFRLHGAQGGQTALQNCLAHGDTLGSGGLLYRQEFTNVGGLPSVTSSTTNTSVAVSDTSTVYWRVTYNPNDSAFQSDCEENTAVTFVNNDGPGTPFP
jgi:hypothetical protein